MARYDYFQHMTSGEVFAVELDGQERVVRSVGPIARADLVADPADASPNMTEADNDWFAQTDAQWRLLGSIEAMQIAARAG